MTIDIITSYTFDAGYTFGAHCITLKNVTLAYLPP